MNASLDAAALVGLLADEDRRRVVAAVVLGAKTIDDLGRVAALPPVRLQKALSRLAAAGLVGHASDGSLELVASAFQEAARHAAMAAGAPDERAGEGESPEAAKVLRAFMRQGRLVSIPVQRSKRLVLLDRLAQEFEPGTRYSEAMVNLKLGLWHEDTAALRRYLVDDGFLDRADGSYWRSGGTVSAG